MMLLSGVHTSPDESPAVREKQTGPGGHESVAKRILWLDNDSSYIRPYVNALRNRGFEVTVKTTLTEAEANLSSEAYDLLILDVMIPTKSEVEEELYPPGKSDLGHKTGLLFYQRVRESLATSKTLVLVLTVRLDREILNEFLDAKLEKAGFATKFGLREVSKFLDKVRSLIGAP
jgi:CheY-like chemotaxis protein